MSGYYGIARKEILPFLPQTLGRVLDVGCGSGATLDMLKNRFSGLWTAGLELVPEQAAQAKAAGHHVWAGKVEDCKLEEFIEAGSLDMVMCLDVLEHLVDPWAAVARLSTLLKPGGKLMVSLPNVRNWKFVLKLLFKGDFRYRDAGLLDRTHLRFFTRETGIELATSSGLAYLSCDPAMQWKAPDARWFLSKISGRKLDTLMAKQFIILAEKTV